MAEIFRFIEITESQGKRGAKQQSSLDDSREWNMELVMGSPTNGRGIGLTYKVPPRAPHHHWKVPGPRRIQKRTPGNPLGHSNNTWMSSRQSASPASLGQWRRGGDVGTATVGCLNLRLQV